jgi:transposase
MMSMPEQPRGTDRAGRRSKRFLSPSQKYEIWLQLVRGETTLADAAARWQVDRSTILRIRTVARDGALAALAASRPGKKARERDHELEQLKARERPVGRGGQGAGDQADAGGGKDSWG